MPESNLPREPFDPKLREAMAKILDIAREYDIGGVFLLASRQHGEVRFRYPTWSVAQYHEHDGHAGFRFKAKSGVTDPRDVAHTRNFLDGIFRETAKIALSMKPLLEHIDYKIGGKTESSEIIPAPPWDWR